MIRDIQFTRHQPGWVSARQMEEIACRQVHMPNCLLDGWSIQKQQLAHYDSVLEWIGEGVFNKLTLFTNNFSHYCQHRLSYQVSIFSFQKQYSIYYLSIFLSLLCQLPRECPVHYKNRTRAPGRPSSVIYIQHFQFFIYIFVSK